MKRVLLAMFVLCASCALLSGCNTVAGIGKDVQKVGEKVEDVAH